MVSEPFEVWEHRVDELLDNKLKPIIRKLNKLDKELLRTTRLLAHFQILSIANDCRRKVLEEKPKAPKSNYIVTGIYMYDHRVFDIIEGLKPSGRGELEITDVNNAYIEKGELTFDFLKGWWSDAGTFDSLLRANSLAAKDQN